MERLALEGLEEFPVNDEGCGRVDAEGVSRRAVRAHRSAAVLAAIHQRQKPAHDAWNGIGNGGDAYRPILAVQKGRVPRISLSRVVAISRSCCPLAICPPVPVSPI